MFNVFTNGARPTSEYYKERIAAAKVQLAELAEMRASIKTFTVTSIPLVLDINDRTLGLKESLRQLELCLSRLEQGEEEAPEPPTRQHLDVLEQLEVLFGQVLPADTEKTIERLQGLLVRTLALQEKLATSQQRHMEKLQREIWALNLEVQALTVHSSIDILQGLRAVAGVLKSASIPNGTFTQAEGPAAEFEEA